MRLCARLNTFNSALLTKLQATDTLSVCYRKTCRDDVLPESIRVREWRHRQFGSPKPRATQVLAQPPDHARQSEF